MANASDLEIEIKVKVENINSLLQFLEKEAKFTGQNRQLDIYYSPKDKSFLLEKPVKEWLRLRTEGGKYFITYKKINIEKDGRSHSKDEYESEVTDLTQMEKIFKALNLQEIVKVDKTRKTYAYNDYEIAIDNVDGLGDFVEIEFKGKEISESSAEITTKMVEFLKGLGVGKITRNYSGYPFQMLFPDEIKVEEYN